MFAFTDRSADKNMKLKDAGGLRMPPCFDFKSMKPKSVKRVSYAFVLDDNR